MQKQINVYSILFRFKIHNTYVVKKNYIKYNFVE